VTIGGHEVKVEHQKRGAVLARVGKGEKSSSKKEKVLAMVTVGSRSTMC
jgi:hypothetical protein